MAKSIEELFVYNEARELVNLIYNATKKKEFSRDYALRDQIRRAAISVVSNIAEGFERKGNKEFSRFLYMSKGSCGEIKAQLMVALDQEYLNVVEYSMLNEKSNKLGKMLSSLIKYLVKYEENS